MEPVEQIRESAEEEKISVDDEVEMIALANEVEKIPVDEVVEFEAKSVSGLVKHILSDYVKV